MIRKILLTFNTRKEKLNVIEKYVSVAPDCFADHTERLCILAVNIICNNQPSYKVKK